MKKGLKRIGLAVVAVGLSITLLLTAAIPLCEAGPDERVVKIGIPITLTGAVAVTGWAGLGFVDRMRYTNEQGILEGVRVECSWIECGQAPIVQSITAHKRFVAEGAALEFSYILEEMEVVAPRLAREGMPIVSGANPSSLTLTKPIPWIFSVTCSADDYYATGPKWFVDNWAEERPVRIGMLMYDQSPAWRGLDGIKALIEGYGPKKAELVGYEVVPLLGAIDTSTEWLRLAEKGCDLIFVLACGSTLNVLVKDCARLEIQEKGITVIECGECMEGTVMSVGEAADGWYMIRYLRSPLEGMMDVADVPGVKALWEAAKKYRGLDQQDLRKGPLYVVGWNLGVIAAEGIRLAAEKVGVENLSGGAIRDGLASINDLDMGGLMQRVTVSDTKPYFSDTAYVYRIQGGEVFCVAEAPIPNTLFLTF